MTVGPASAGAAPSPAIAAALVAAMDEEIEPFVALASDVGEEGRLGNASARRATLSGRSVLLVRSGIGLVNAASAATAVIQRWQPGLVLSVGSAGGIRGKVQVGDVVASTHLVYSTADATGFGYALGQVPGMPARFQGDPEVLSALGEDIARGAFASGDVFVTGQLLDSVVERFPEVSVVDMESTAIAQVCHSYDVPFCSVRGISDLCGPAADTEHAERVDDVSARAATRLISVLPKLLEL